MSYSLKRKFQDLSLDEVDKYKISKVEINNVDNNRSIYKVKKLKNIEKVKKSNCQIHTQFNSCMIYNCPGISTERYNKNTVNKNNYDYYS